MSCIIYQYAVKVIQGKIKVGSKTQPIGPGNYFTSVNVHNPWRHEVKYAIKLAISGLHGKPGMISPFHCYHLGPDKAMEYDYWDFDSLLPPLPSFLESYFVIESEEELDVVGVYTGAAIQNGHLGAMHMERVPARVIPRCKDLKMDISTGVAQWRLSAVPLIGSTLVVGPAPIATTPYPSTWAPPTSPAQWIGTSVDTGLKDYIYELSFCLCWTFQNAQIKFDLWADNQATIFFNNIPTSPSATPLGLAYLLANVTPVTISLPTSFKIGMNTLKVVVTNTKGTGKNPSGMLLQGTLSANAADCTS